MKAIDRITKEYKSLRRKGWQPLNAWSAAKTREAFRKAEYAGLVRLRIAPDDSGHTIDDLAGDTFNPKANPDIPKEQMDRERQEFIDRVNRDGVCGVIGEWSLDCDCANVDDCEEHTWNHADSCWGFVGDDWKESGYDDDCRSITLDALKVELRSRQLVGLGM